MGMCGNEFDVTHLEGCGLSGSGRDYDSSELGSDLITDFGESAGDAVSRNCSEVSLTSVCRDAVVADLPIRRAVIAEIFKMFVGGCSQKAVAPLPVDRGTLPALVRRLEKVLYESASSTAEYSDLSSLKDRLCRTLVKLKRSHGQSGDHSRHMNVNTADPVDLTARDDELIMMDLPDWATVDLDQLNGCDTWTGEKRDRPTECTEPNAGHKRQRSDTSDDGPGNESFSICAQHGNHQRLVQSWHDSDLDYHLRKLVIVQVMQLFVNDGPWVPILPQSFKPMLPAFIRRLEAELYRQALSRKEYCDINTLPARLHAIAQRLLH